LEHHQGEEGRIASVYAGRTLSVNIQSPP